MLKLLFAAALAATVLATTQLSAHHADSDTAACSAGCSTAKAERLARVEAPVRAAKVRVVGPAYLPDEAQEINVREIAAANDDVANRALNSVFGWSESDEISPESQPEHIAAK